MLKNITRLSLIAGVMISGSAMATNFGSASTSSSVSISPANCTALNNNVTIQLSKGVFAAYDCNAATVLAGTCHSAGTYKQQTVSCSYTVNITSAGVSVSKSSPGCADWDGSGSAPVGNTDTFNGRLGFRGGSGGGTVGQINLESATCDGNAIDSKVVIQ
jgi:hypothetical protein